jgi:hypothetical protein
MIRKNEEQFDSGGIIFKYTFLLPYRNVANGYSIFKDNITEEDVDKLVKEYTPDFEFDLKLFFMLKLGYTGKDDNGNWVKNVNNE